MQEEVENRTLTLVVSGTKFTGRMFKAAISKYMDICQRQRQKCPQMKSPTYMWSSWENMQDGKYRLSVWGKVGTGKSYFAGCIANALMEQEVAVSHDKLCSDIK